MDRRALIQVVSIGAASGSFVRAQHVGHCAAEMAASPYQPRFLTASEHALLQDLMDIILPADEHSPGARAARTADFGDWMLAHSSCRRSTKMAGRSELGGSAGFGCGSDRGSGGE